MKSKLPLRCQSRRAAKLNGTARDELLDERQAAKFLGLSVSWLQKSRQTRPVWAGPKFIQPDGYHVKYSRRHLEEFLATRNGGPRVIDPAERLAAAS